MSGRREPQDVWARVRRLEEQVTALQKVIWSLAFPEALLAITDVDEDKTLPFDRVRVGVLPAETINSIAYDSRFGVQVRDNLDVVRWERSTRGTDFYSIG